MHLISLEAISKSYPETPVLRDVSLGISRRQRIGVIGRNGSGKSTLLRIIGGIEEPDAGRIVRATGLRITFLDQDPSFPDENRVGDIIGGDRDSIAMADRLGLTDSSALVADLSGGQRKRLALAVALAAECDLLILDEPTNHLDVDTIDWLEDHLLSAHIGAGARHPRSIPARPGCQSGGRSPPRVTFFAPRHLRTVPRGPDRPRRTRSRRRTPQASASPHRAGVAPPLAKGAHLEVALHASAPSTTSSQQSDRRSTRSSPSISPRDVSGPRS